MNTSVAIYFDAKRTASWTWEDFLNGDVGMSGTDGQLLLLVNDLSKIYKVYFFTNTENKHYKNFKTFEVADAAEAAAKCKELFINLFIFNNRGDTDTINAIKKLAILKQPFVLWDQNGPAPDFEVLLAGNEWLKRIVCVSRTHANAHRHKKYFPKITYIYNGKDYKPSNKKDKTTQTFNAGYIGAVSESKGFQWVAKTWMDVKKVFPQATLTVIGSIKTHDRDRNTGDFGIAEPLFEQNFIKPYLGKNITEIENNGIKFTGHISPNEMSGILKTLDIGIVNPNTKGFGIETFCVSAIDFQGNNIPVIGGNAGGLKETVNHNETGILIKHSNKLATAAIALMHNKEKLNYLSDNCSSWVKQNFSRYYVITQWRKMIDDIIENKKNKPLKLNLNDITIKLLAKEALRIKKFGLSRSYLVC